MMRTKDTQDLNIIRELTFNCTKALRFKAKLPLKTFVSTPKPFSWGSLGLHKAI